MGLNRTGTDIGQGEWQITQSPAIAKQFLKDIKEGEKNPEDDSVQQYLDQILMALSALGKNFVKIV
ncbi:MAG: hypothetical protein OEL89_04800, partial [Candidatus Peregrinibacteria bacterium]|nr:hypothetical protein [Candidatus Peregrinibacteria bacterium]